MIDPATIDFETFSVAGFKWNESTQKWECLPGAPQKRKGLFVVGAAAYAEHPSTIILTLSYFLPGFPGVMRWRPGDPPPQALLDWVTSGKPVEAHSVMFERLIWHHVATRLHGWPPLIPENLYCSAATARVNNYPGALANLGEVLNLDTQKDKEGKRLLNKFSIPRNPTKADKRLWIRPDEDPVDGPKLYGYCDTDVLTEIEASRRMKPMTPAEREIWLIDQEINWRGLAIDRKGVRDCISILNQALEKYSAEYAEITGGLGPSQLEATKGWLAANGLRGVHSLDADALEMYLGYETISPQVRRVLEIRALVGSASVKKLFAMELTASNDDRIRNLIVHHGARTGRPTGEGAQPLNMPKEGPKLATCSGCSKPFHPKNFKCPWCGTIRPPEPRLKWSPEMADPVLEIMGYRSLDLVELFFDDAVLAIMGCVRSLFTGGTDPNTGQDLELIASDYSAIEAVVTAMLAGEQWRIDTFKAKTDIYLESAAKIMTRPGGAQFYIDWAKEHGENHPDRQKIGKVAELGLGFGGWINAWRVFDDSDTFTDDEVKGHIKAWREASPKIVEMWGGQWRGPPWNGYAERYGFEGAAINAIQYPGHLFEAHGIKFERRIDQWGDALIVTLLSGRELTYHQPTLQPSTREYASPGELQIWYMTWNTNPKYGALGWVPMQTFGGRLTENIVQAIAHDILRFAIINLRAAGFPTVLHVYDEIVVEVLRSIDTTGTTPDPRVEQVEAIMGTMPPWAHDWPVRASGGWSGKRYRKG